MFTRRGLKQVSFHMRFFELYYLCLTINPLLKTKIDLLCASKRGTLKLYFHPWNRQSEDQSARRGDRPAREGNRPAREGDRPVREGDRPAREGDLPAGSGDRQRAKGVGQPEREWDVHKAGAQLRWCNCTPRYSVHLKSDHVKLCSLYAMKIPLLTGQQLIWQLFMLWLSQFLLYHQNRGIERGSTSEIVWNKFWLFNQNKPYVQINWFGHTRRLKCLKNDERK